VPTKVIVNNKYKHDGWGGLDISEGVTNLTPAEVKELIREWRGDDVCNVCLEVEIPPNTIICDDCLAKIVQAFDKRQ
jgi:hypothetical protein